MDKIWAGKSFEVGGHWPLWRGSKKRMTTQNRQKSNAKKKKKNLSTSAVQTIPFIHIIPLPFHLVISSNNKHIHLVKQADPYANKRCEPTGNS